MSGAELSVTRRQMDFIKAQADEVLFGGAAGGGKSYGQMLDALLYALRYPGSHQLILRRTFPELERSLIRTALEIYPAALYRYNSQKKTLRFTGGSVIDFGYCDSDTDVVRYQSAQYDVIRFDELTHFTEYMYTYLLSRLRGANPFPKQMKSTANPGGVGHDWVKARFVDPSPPDRLFQAVAGSRIYLPSRVDDNRFLMESDPGYKKRLENLPEQEQKALLYGDWDILSGRYFPEFGRDTHVVGSACIPLGARVYRSIDYGLDRLACLWIWVDSMGRAQVFREYCVSDRIISKAAEEILLCSSEEAECTFAPPDLWSRQRESGVTAADLFAAAGLPLVRCHNRRTDGWLALKELLRPSVQPEGDTAPRLTVWEGCTELIRCLMSIRRSELTPDDCAVQPHHLTHAPDALRYFAASGVCTPWEEETESNEIRRYLSYGM